MAATAIITAASAFYGVVSSEDQARRANREKANAKVATRQREAELAAEAAAKEAANKKAETAGQRAGFGTDGALSFRSAFTTPGTGFGNAAEDNIRRGTLFGN